MAAENVRINPQYVYIGKDTMQEQQITCKADVSGSLGAKYFLFHDSAGAKHYAWFDTGSSVDPAPVGSWTGHQVIISSGDSAASVATDLAAILGAISGFDATASGSVVTLTHTVAGYAMPARDTFITLKKTGFSFKVTVLGQSKVSAGCIDGEIEISGMKKEIEEIKCHASGSTPIAEIIKGYSKPEIKFTLQETTKENYKKVLVLAGAKSFVNEGADQAEVFGWGSSNIGGSNPQVQVEFHPVALDSTDKTEDITFWKAQIELDKFDFSGEKKSTIPVSFSVYPDSAKPKEINMFMFGDAVAAGF